VNEDRASLSDAQWSATSPFQSHRIEFVRTQTLTSSCFAQRSVFTTSGNGCSSRKTAKPASPKIKRASPKIAED